MGILCQGSQANVSEITNVDHSTKAEALALLDAEIKRLTELKELSVRFDQQTGQRATVAAVVPSHEALDRIIRYEAHLSREIDRTLNRLERLQRMRLGQPAPPTVKAT
jgi:hypothetical protein